MAGNLILDELSAGGFEQVVKGLEIELQLWIWLSSGSLDNLWLDWELSELSSVPIPLWKQENS